MRIAEIYRSRQGEGLLTGFESVFVRVSGCNLRCWFCDTPYASWEPEGEDWAWHDVAARVLEDSASHVVITGGEPFIYSELSPLTEFLRGAGRHITIETAGTLFLDVACDLLSLSPKLANSTPGSDRAGSWAARHERTRSAPDVIRRLTAAHPYQIKFVIDTPPDCDAVEQWLAEFPTLDRSRVMLMPQARSVAEQAERAAWLAPYCREHGFHYCPRRQLEWFGPRRGT